MATVKKISRSVNYLPPIKTLTEWFNYAFKSSELDEVHRFPSLSGGGGGGGGPGGEQVSLFIRYDLIGQSITIYITVN